VNGSRVLSRRSQKLVFISTSCTDTDLCWRSLAKLSTPLTVHTQLKC